jgi:hypothetical protein
VWIKAEVTALDGDKVQATLVRRSGGMKTQGKPENRFVCKWLDYPLVNIRKTNWKITSYLMDISTISTGLFSMAILT